MVAFRPRGSGGQYMKVTLLMIGADYHPGFQQIAFVIPILGSSRNGGCNTLRKRKSSTAILRPRECRCAWGWKRGGRHAGLSVALGFAFSIVDRRCSVDPDE